MSTSGSFLQNNSTMIHICAEIILFGGLAFWFTKKVSSAEEKIEALTKQVTDLETLLKAQGDIIAQHQNALQSIYAILDPSSQQKSHLPSKNPHPRGPQRQPQQPQRFKQESPQKSNRNDIPKSFGKVTEHVEDIDEELDEELADEIADLSSRVTENDYECDVDDEDCAGKKKRTK